MSTPEAVEFYRPATREWACTYAGNLVKVQVYPDPVFRWIVVRVCGSNGHSGVEGRFPSPPARLEDIVKAVEALPLPLSVADFAAMGFEVAEWHWREFVPPGRPDPRCHEGLAAFLPSGEATESTS